MKNISQIAADLRAKGRKFSQTVLIKTLEDNCTPVVKHGRAVIYEDNAVDVMLAIFPDRTLQQVSVMEPSQEIQVLRWPDDTEQRLDYMQKQLNALCMNFNVIV